MDDYEDQLDESRRVSALLVRSAERAKARFADAVAPFGLPVPLARALLLLEKPAPMRTLAERFACDQSYVTALADDLEERGLITRVAGTDRRVKLLTLTTSGAALRAKMLRAVAEQSPVLRRLDDAERAALGELLGRLLE